MPKIFISYRRKDSAPIVGRIYERLVREFGESNIFYDMEDIPKGKNFKDVLRQSVASCDVLLAMIGPQWAAITDANGKKRLFDENDYVRYEVDTALRLPKVTVIPVLISDADMPSQSDLPSLLQSLTELNAIKVRNDPDFRRDMDDLIKAIKPTRSRIPVGLVLAVILILAAIGFGIFAPRLFQPVTALTSTLTPTTLVSSPTDQPTFTLTPTAEPSDTPLPPSETPSPTDAPTPIPPSVLPTVSISVPTVVLPNTTILVTAWQNAHCVFTSDNGKAPIPFDTSTGNIQYSVKEAGVIVSIVCEDAQGRHEENQFVVSAAAIATATLTSTSTLIPTATAIPELLSPTSIPKSFPCDATIILKGSDASKINGQVFSQPRNTSTTLPISLNVGQKVIVRQINTSSGTKWYQIVSANNSLLGWIRDQYLSLALSCPV